MNLVDQLGRVGQVVVVLVIVLAFPAAWVWYRLPSYLPTLRQLWQKAAGLMNRRSPWALAPLVLALVVAIAWDCCGVERVVPEGALVRMPSGAVIGGMAGATIEGDVEVLPPASSAEKSAPP